MKSFLKLTSFTAILILGLVFGGWYGLESFAEKRVREGLIRLGERLECAVSVDSVDISPAGLVTLKNVSMTKESELELEFSQIECVFEPQDLILREPIRPQCLVKSRLSLSSFEDILSVREKWSAQSAGSSGTQGGFTRWVRPIAQWDWVIEGSIQASTRHSVEGVLTWMGEGKANQAPLRAHGTIRNRAEDSIEFAFEGLPELPLQSSSISLYFPDGASVGGDDWSAALLGAQLKNKNLSLESVQGELGSTEWEADTVRIRGLSFSEADLQSSIGGLLIPPNLECNGLSVTSDSWSARSGQVQILRTGKGTSVSATDLTVVDETLGTLRIPVIRMAPIRLMRWEQENPECRFGHRGPRNHPRAGALRGLERLRASKSLQQSGGSTVF